MKILIGQSYHRILDPKELKRNMPYPPLGALYIATILKNLNHEIIFHDSMIAENADEFKKLIIKTVPDLILLYDDEFNYLTKMCLLNMRKIAFEYITLSKQLKIPIFVYNSDAIDHSDIYLNAGCDLVMIGEAEETTLELVTNFEKLHSDNSLLNSIKGIKYYESDGIMIFTGNRNLINNLDKLPDPDYNLTNIKIYKAIWLKHHNYFSLNISTTRGCPYSCNWCAKPLYGRTYSFFSPKRVVNLINKLVQTFEVDHIWITDDIFGLKHSWLVEFSQLMSETNLKLKKGIKCLSRADLLSKNSTLELMEKSLVRNIWIGAESGSQSVLDRMDKNIKVEQIYEVVNQAKYLNLEISFFIQLGYLYETWNDINLTRNLIKKCVPEDIGISVSYPLPGTKFYSMVSDLLSEKQNWTDSDDLDLMYLGNFPSKFYKLLHRFIHTEYNLIKAFKRKSYKSLYTFPIYGLMFVYFRTRLQFYL
jgi:anaerobic magnesium-protoporphyrin IX monomethyl ester cyclase